MAANKAVKVYGWAVPPFVARALLALEEAGVGYELVPTSRDAGDQHRPDHLARNPFGQVPVLEDGDLTRFESRAIARHVVRKHKPELLWGGSLEESAMVDVWLEVEAHQHHPAAGAIVMQCLITPLIGGARDQAVVDENVSKLRAVLGVYEARLSRSRYLAGDFVSVADLSHFPLMATSWPPSTPRWWRRCHTSGRGGRSSPPGRRPGSWRSSCRWTLGCPRKMRSDEQCRAMPSKKENSAVRCVMYSFVLMLSV